MGVIHPEHIARYSLSSLDYTDYLSIVYDRPKNSVLPVTRTYRFPRLQDDDGDSSDVRMNTDPALQEALEELRDVVDAKSDQRDLAATMRDELRHLEEEFALHTEHLRTLIKKMES